jgi:hypothetical protein
MELTDAMNAAVAAEIGRLRDADDAALDALNEDSTARRLKWFEEIMGDVDLSGGPIRAAYELLRRRFGASEAEMPVVRATESEIVFRSMNFCPTLEACRTLGLDTRHVCRRMNERSTNTLIRQIDRRLTFTRDYSKLRPFSPYCEESITLERDSMEFSEAMKEAVNTEIARLRGADDAALDALNEDLTERRLRWYEENKDDIDLSGGPVLAAYRLLLRLLGATAEELPVVRSSERQLVFHSLKFCPIQEACRVLGLDTRHVCHRLNERSADALIKKIDPRLSFSRNYEKLRPYATYCEEIITLT